MKRKLIQAMSKLIKISMNHHLAGAYYNICMLMGIYYGCGIIDLNEKEKEKEELWRICKE